MNLKSTFKKEGRKPLFFARYLKRLFYCPFNSLYPQISLLKIETMVPLQSIRRNLALKEYEIKETPQGRQTTFSIKFVKKNGELVFLPRAVASGLKMNMKDNRMRGLVPVDPDNNSIGHITPFHIDGMIQWNGKKVKM